MTGTETAAFGPYRTRAHTDPTFVLPPAHVTNLGIAALFDQQRQAFLRDEIGYQDGPDIRPPQITLGQTTIRFFAEVRHPVTVQLDLSVARIGTASFQLVQTMSTASSALARCESVFVSLGEGGSAPVAPERRDLLERYLTS